jgi:GDPmannose 4,6-dehydratase
LKTALIIGISSQDGSILTNFLIKKGGYKIYGSSRNCNDNSFQILNKLSIIDKVDLINLNLLNLEDIKVVLKKIKPDEIYNFSGQSSVSYSFQYPYETIVSNFNSLVNIIEAIRVTEKNIKFFNACSSECFGDTNNRVNEESDFNPKSPYGVSKASSFEVIKNYRDVYGLFLCSGILSNHESVFRNEKFISKKIINSAYNISIGKQKTLEVGDITIIRDWGWAEDYVEAMYLILQNSIPEDFIIATGKQISLTEFIDCSFRKYNLDYKDYIIINNNFIRNYEIKSSLLNPEKINRKLGWLAKRNVYDVIDLLSDSIKIKK